MKKVLVYGLKNMWGGLERYLLSMNELINNEVSMCYLVEQCDCMHLEKIRELGGVVVYLPSRHPLGNHIRELSRILKSMRKETDTLYVNVNGISFDIAVIVLGLIYGYRVMVHSHNAMMEPIKHPVYRIIHKTLETAALILLRCLNVKRLAVSDKAAKYLFGNREYSLVVPGVEIDRFAFDEDERRKIRGDLGLDEQIVFGFVGRLTAVKNPDYVLNVFKEICSIIEFENAQLMLVGDGPMRVELEEKVSEMQLQDKVFFVGEISDPAPYYCAMDYMLLPSQSEGLSLVTIEAQAAGLPISCSEGRFPATIALTSLLNFISLDCGEKIWANSCVAHFVKFAGCSRENWNKEMRESCFEIKKAAQVLRDILLEV